MTHEEFIRNFGDCAEAQAGPALGGIFDGEGLKELSKVQMTSTPQGPRCLFRCQECGVPWDMLLDWDSMAYVANRVKPPGWDYDPHERRLAPANTFCRCGDYKLAPMFTADEAKNALQAAISQGWYPAQRAAQITQHIQQAQRGQQPQPGQQQARR